MGFKAIFAGDVVISEDIEDSILSDEISTLFLSHDIRCVNFEAPILSKELPTEKVGPSVSQIEKSAEILKNAGVNLLSLANNHIMDYGISTLKATKDKLSFAKTVGVGLSFEEAYSPAVFDIDNTTIAIFSFAEWGFGSCDGIISKEGFAYIFNQSILNLISESASKYDVCIVCAHAGLEDAIIPLPQWRECYKSFIDAGAKAVIGHHPHIIQGVEVYKDCPIFYSLGNFYFDGFENTEEWNRGLCASLEFERGSLIDFKTISVERINNEIFLSDKEVFKEALKYRSDILKDRNRYENLLSEIIKYYWDNVYVVHYHKAFNHLFGRGFIVDFASKIYRKITGRADPNKYNYLLHNIAIDTHRFLCMLFLSRL